VYRGVCRWTPFSLVGTRIAGLAAVSYWLLDRRSFSGFAMTAAALLSTNARLVSDTRFTFRFSKYTALAMKLHRGGCPRDVPPSVWPKTRRIDRLATSQRQPTTRCRPRLPLRRTRSMQCAAACTPRTGLLGRTRLLSRRMLAPLRVRLANRPLNQLALHNIRIEFALGRVGHHLPGRDQLHLGRR